MIRIILFACTFSTDILYSEKLETCFPELIWWILELVLVFFVFDENISCHFKQMILTAIETAISQGFFKLITNLMKWISYIRL